MQTKGDYMGHYAENGIIENPIGTLNKKDYKLKRPEKGYNTPAEREWSAWSDVSDWELFFKGQIDWTCLLCWHFSNAMGRLFGRRLPK